MKLSFRPNDSLRVKVMSACNLNCNFCHNEGTHELFPAMTSPQFDEVIHFATEFGFRELHFTGGEPTLNRLLPEFAETATRNGLSVNMTTNGNFREGLIERLTASGFQTLTFSFHGHSPLAWAKVQQNTSVEVAETQRNLTLKRMEEAQRAGLTVKINIVVADGIAAAKEVASSMIEKGYSVRLLDVLGQPGTVAHIDHLLQILNGQHRSTTITAGTSQVKTEYITSIGSLTVKSVRNFHIPSICEGGSNCYEKFYGIRIETRRNTVLARLCLCGPSLKSLMSLHSLPSSKQFQDILDASNVELRNGG